MKADTTTETEVMATLNNWADSYSKRDIDALMSFLSPNADLVLYGIGADEKRIGPGELKIQVQRDWAQT
ncbi:MAG: nuclear transport factor 2 family protein [Dehalococcoidia bacterium]